jgi:hypothetical protein
MDCGVAAYDNTKGLPPFFPTRLRFEDYIYRVWIQQAGFVAAHVDAAQNHEKNPYMRNAPASEVFNEEVANFLKRKILATTSAIGELSIDFAYDGEVTVEDADAILSKIRALHARAKRAVEESPIEHGAELKSFTHHVEKVFFGFEPDFFQHNLFRIVNEVVRVIKESLELWPTLLEIAYFHKGRKGLPKTRVKNLKH